MSAKNNARIAEATAPLGRSETRLRKGNGEEGSETRTPLSEAAQMA
jgi:hypothetical protein